MRAAEFRRIRHRSQPNAVAESAELGSADQAVDRRGSLAAIVGTGKEPIFCGPVLLPRAPLAGHAQ